MDYTSDINTKAYAEAHYKALAIPGYEQMTWDYTNIHRLAQSLGDYSNYGWIFGDIINATKETMLFYDVPFPSNLEQFVRQVFNNINTNYDVSIHPFRICMNTTNEYLDDVYVDLLTTRWSQVFTYPHWSGKMESILFRDVCISALRSIGTPKAMDKLNKGLRNLLNAGVYKCYEPGFGISPDKYPKDAEDWLFNYPEIEVRKVMIEEWLHSSQPETVEIIQRKIKELEKLPKEDPYFTAGYNRDEWPYCKKVMLDEMKNKVAMFERRRKRWLKDDKRGSLQLGIYSDDYWDMYCTDKSNYYYRFYKKPLPPRKD